MRFVVFGFIAAACVPLAERPALPPPYTLSAFDVGHECEVLVVRDTQRMGLCYGFLRCSDRSHGAAALASMGSMDCP